jgi:hypothetical protein
MESTMVTIIASTISMAVGIITVHLAHARTAKRVESMAKYLTMFSAVTMEHIRVLRKETNLSSWERNDDEHSVSIKL